MHGAWSIYTRVFIYNTTAQPTYYIYTQPTCIYTQHLVKLYLHRVPICQETYVLYIAAVCPQHTAGHWTLRLLSARCVLFAVCAGIYIYMQAGDVVEATHKVKLHEPPIHTFI